MDHCNLNRLVASVRATVLNVLTIALLEQINKASDPWYAITDLTRVFFSVPNMNENQKICIHMKQAKNFLQLCLVDSYFSVPLL